MPNGKHGDHPITDVCIHKLAVYGEPTDTLLREIVDLLGYQRAHEWFNAIWNKPKQTICAEIATPHQLLKTDAKERGWEINPNN